MTGTRMKRRKERARCFRNFLRSFSFWRNLFSKILFCFSQRLRELRFFGWSFFFICDKLWNNKFIIVLFYESEFIVHFFLLFGIPEIEKIFFDLACQDSEFFRNISKVSDTFAFQWNDISQKSLHFASKELFFDFRHKIEIIELFYLLKHFWRHNMFKIHLILHSNIHEVSRVRCSNLSLRWFEFHYMISFLQPYIQKLRLLIVQ